MGETHKNNDSRKSMQKSIQKSNRKSKQNSNQRSKHPSDQNSNLPSNTASAISPDAQRWLDYLDGKLNPEEREQLEREVEDSDFLAEAMEGLKEQSAPSAHLAGIVHQLNHDLRKQLEVRKRKRRRDGTQHQQWIWIVAILIVLAVCFAISFYIAKRY